MPITHKLLGKVIAECYSSKPVVEKEFVAFGIEMDDLVIEATASLFEDPANADSERQAVQIWFWFCHKNKQRFNLAKLPFSELLVLCHTLQEDLEWSNIAPNRIDERLVHIGLYLSIDITEEDLRAACNENTGSLFLRTLERMSIECLGIFPTLATVADKQVFSLSQVELLISEPAGHA